MKKNKIILPLFIAILFLGSSFIREKKNIISSEDKWTGWVSFSEVRTGTNIVIYKWLMEARVRNNLGAATHSFRFRDNEGRWDTCYGASPTELFVDFDPAKPEYNLSAYIPYCPGSQWTGGAIEKSGQAESTFLVERQHLGSNPDSLIGRIIDRSGPQGEYHTISVLTWEWKLGKQH